jgi:hypothetical protein
VKIFILRRIAAIALTVLAAGSAAAFPVSGSTKLGIDFNLGITGNPVTELGVGFLFNNTSFDPGEVVRVTIFESEGGAQLGTVDVDNPFAIAISNVGYSLTISAGLSDGIGFATYEAVTGSFDMSGGTFNSFAPVVQTQGVTGTNLHVLGSTGPTDPGTGGTPLPEPDALVLLASAGAAALLARRRAQQPR